MTQPRLVVIESPFAGDVHRNVAYARRALADSLARGEAPIASHLLYPQCLDDSIEEQRAQGIAAGLAWGAAAFYVDRAAAAAFYVDRGWSTGMIAARRHWEALGLAVEVRNLGRK